MSRTSILLLTAIWLCGMAAGFTVLGAYSSIPGRAGEPPAEWPAGSRLPAPNGRFTLVTVLHPQCPCSRATLAELDGLMAHLEGRLRVHALFVRPAGLPGGWERTDLWRHAVAIPGVSAWSDEDGAEARRFRAATSGQTMLYAPGGKLLFSGGLTAARGHRGDSLGRRAVAAFVETGQSERSETPVFGCHLFSGDEGAGA